MEKDGKLSSLLERLKDCNISHFKKNFIIAGPKINVLAIHNVLRKAGIYDPFHTRSKEYSRHKNIVVLCTNDINSTGILNFPKISILTRGWWIMYHCKKYPHTTEVYHTYNVPKQQKEVFNNIVLTPIEVLEAE